MRAAAVGTAADDSGKDCSRGHPGGATRQVCGGKTFKVRQSLHETAQLVRNNEPSVGMKRQGEVQWQENSAGFEQIFDLDGPPQIDLPGVTALVLCHNESLQLRTFLDFHKACGIGHFLVVDNESADGSDEILNADPDVTRFERFLVPWVSA